MYRTYKDDLGKGAHEAINNGQYSENDYYRENTSVGQEELNGTTDGEGDETVSYIEELPSYQRQRKRSRSRRPLEDIHRGHRRAHMGSVPNNRSRSSKRSVSQRSQLSKKSCRS